MAHSTTPTPAPCSQLAPGGVSAAAEGRDAAPAACGAEALGVSRQELAAAGRRKLAPPAGPLAVRAVPADPARGWRWCLGAAAVRGLLVPSGGLRVCFSGRWGSGGDTSSLCTGASSDSSVALGTPRRPSGPGRHRQRCSSEVALN